MCVMGARRATTQDRIVLVSNYTQTLDLMATMLRNMGFPYLRLDGSTSAAKRQVGQPSPLRARPSMSLTLPYRLVVSRCSVWWTSSMTSPKTSSLSCFHPRPAGAG